MEARNSRSYEPALRRPNDAGLIRGDETWPVPTLQSFVLENRGPKLDHRIFQARNLRRFQLLFEILDFGRRCALYYEPNVLELSKADSCCVLDIGDSELQDRELASRRDFELTC